MNIPIYRAKRIDSNEYVIGYYQTETGTNVEDKNNMFSTLRHIIIDLDKHQLRLDLFGDKKLHDDSHIREQYEIDTTTISINFPDMIDSQGNKIFASLREDGKGGDIVEGKCRDVNGDTITRLHKPLPYKGLVRFYKETLMSVVIETKDEIIEETKGWSTPIYANRGKALRWCDCRQDIKVIGIQE